MAGLGRQFDPGYGRRFTAMGREGVLDHIVMHSDDGIPLLDCPRCGPTLVMRGDQRSGARLYCPSCSGEFVVEAEPDGKAWAVYNGRHGTARELEPEPELEPESESESESESDNALIEDRQGSVRCNVGNKPLMPG